MNDKSRSPVQPSAVVSREMVQVGFFEKIDDGFELRHFHEGMNDVPDRWVAAYADKKYWSDFLKEKPYQKDQLPHPVAPVQSGGVDLMDEISKAFEAGENVARWGFGKYPMKEEYLAHLTTTQSAPSGMRGFTPEEAKAYSEGLKKLGNPTGRTFQESAPSVGSVPSVLEILDVIFANDGGTIEPEGPVPMRIAKAIHALITERMGTK